MNSKAMDLLEALGDIPEELLSEAAHEKLRPRLWKRWIAAAAVVVSAGIGASLLYHYQNSAALVEQTELPLFSAGMDFGEGGSGGCSEITADIYSNSWRENISVSTLPVFKNQNCVDEDGFASLPFDSIRGELVRQMKTAAEALGAEMNENDITDDRRTKEQIRDFISIYGTEDSDGISDTNTDATRISVETERLRIIVDRSFHTYIWYHHDSRPDKVYRCGNYEETMQTAEQLRLDYPGIFAAAGIKNPVPHITSTGTGSGFNITFYEAGSDPEQDIVNSGICYVNFYGFDDMKLDGIHIQRHDMLSEYLGDYPLLTVEEAAEQLKSGNFYCSDPRSEDVYPDGYSAVALQYSFGQHSQYFCPYYIFYVKIPYEPKDRDNTEYYSVFLVPAVRPEYLIENQQ